MFRRLENKGTATAEDRICIVLICKWRND